MIDRLEWNGEIGMGSVSTLILMMQKIPILKWYTNGTVSGTDQFSRNLSYYVVYNSGHMVSLDQPAAGLDLFYKSIGVYNDIFKSSFKVNFKYLIYQEASDPQNHSDVYQTDIINFA